MSVGSVAFVCICIFLTYSTPYCNLSELLMCGMYSLFLSYYVYVCINVFVCMHVSYYTYVCMYVCV
jgi:hypothetical protein